MFLYFRNIRVGSDRAGVTILEVLFAMGVVIVGLLGIASILPLAGRQAGDSARMSESQALANDWYGEFVARGFHKPLNWQMYKDHNPGPGWTAYEGNLGVTKSGSPACMYNRITSKQAVCIDPSFFSDRDVSAATTAATLFTQPFSGPWYRPAVFPYYQDRYNPTVDPAYTIGATASTAWNDQPRMVRVTLSVGGSRANAKYIEQIFGSQDDLSIVTEQVDRSIAPTRGISFYGDVAAGSPLPLARGAAKTEYSWIATVCPNEVQDTLPTEYATLSLVVVNKRDRLFFQPSSPPPVRSGDPEPDEKPEGERLVWVYSHTGDFVGGSGGRVRLIATDGVSDSIHIGDWIMLSKNISLTTDGAYSVFRWYRIVAADVDSITGDISTVSPSGTDPFGNSPPDNVWGRDVVLDGPDWSFAPTYTSPGISMFTPTTATIVSGATAVIERVVPLH